MGDDMRVVTAGFARGLSAAVALVVVSAMALSVGISVSHVGASAALVKSACGGRLVACRGSPCFDRCGHRFRAHCRGRCSRRCERHLCALWGLSSTRRFYRSRNLAQAGRTARKIHTEVMKELMVAQWYTKSFLLPLSHLFLVSIPIFLLSRCRTRPRPRPKRQKMRRATVVSTPREATA